MVQEAAQPLDLVGTRIAHFRVVALLGRGGMGVVYLAEDEALRRSVALKVLPPGFADDEDRRRRLLREARSAAAVSHPSIATVHEVGEADGRIYIAMELVRGRSLADVLGERRLPVPEALRIAGRILDGVGKAHEAGLVHRDLKPDNVMITDEGAIKVLDFGVAKPLSQAVSAAVLEVAETVTHASTGTRVVGTPSYMSPEQARGEEVDQRSDVFSFGVVLYEMLTGKRPFVGNTAADVIAAILRDEPAPVASLSPEVPPALARIVERCLAKEPGDRYGDCRSLAADLARALDEGEEATPKPPRRRLRGVWAMGAAAALALACGGALLLRPKAPGAAPAPSASAPVASASAAPRATAITAQPLPPSKEPAAIAAYAGGLQALRDANWGLAREDLRRAITLDPSLAAAHLRLAVLLEPMQGRAELERAFQGRASLSARDQAVLQAVEPRIARDPPDNALAAERLREVAKRYPLDAEIFGLLEFYEPDPATKLAVATRATELDPLYADAWQGRSTALGMLGRMDESLAAVDRCVEISPASADCLAERATKYGALGRCEAMEGDLRRALAASPSALADWYAIWAKALYALGRPDEAVLQALAQRWARLPEAERRQDELRDRSTLAWAKGDFTQAEALLREADRAAGADPNAELHENALNLVLVLREMGRAKDAAGVAKEYLERVDGWRDSISAGGTLTMLAAMFHGGALSREELRAKRAAWLARAKPVFGDDPVMLWMLTYGGELETPDEAKEAIAALSGLPRYATDPANLASLRLGQAYMLAGRVDEALPFLRREQRSCFALGSPTHNRDLYYLGLALEQKGDTPGACEAYAAVLERWGNAKPGSVTGKKAHAHSAALGCRR